MLNAQADLLRAESTTTSRQRNWPDSSNGVIQAPNKPSTLRQVQQHRVIGARSQPFGPANTNSTP